MVYLVIGYSLSHSVHGSEKEDSMVKKCSVKNFRLVWIGAEVRLYASVAETFGYSATFYVLEKR